MSTTSKSPLAVARVAYRVGQSSLPRYSSKFSRQDYTCAQLFAILALRQFFKTDYRGIEAIISQWREMRDALELVGKTPHFTTVQKASGRLLADALIRKMFTQTVADFHGIPEPDVHHGKSSPRVVQPIEQTAADSTGFEATRCSRYFTSRRKQGKTGDEPVAYRKFPKLHVLTDTDNQMILATYCGQGPRPDVDELESLMKGVCPNVWIEQLLADAGYDSEANHELLRDTLGIESIIPATSGRPTNKLPVGKHRFTMATRFDDETYGNRWQVETVMFMLKARQGSELKSRSDEARAQEMNLMAVTHNILILRRGGFLQGIPDTVSPPSEIT